MLRPFWQNIFKFNWIFGLVLVLAIGIPRFLIVLNANVKGNYSMVSLIFLFMWFTPLIFLTKKGRRYIGIKKPFNYASLFYSFITGMAICGIMYLVAWIFFKETISNWFVYISKSYNVSGDPIRGSEKNMYFLIYAFTGMTLSPIGEELFYRALVNGSFAESWGKQKASLADSLAFALTHLAHFGIVYISGVWRFLFVPALLWVVFMFLTSRVFFMCKEKTGSVLGAILSHSGFNLAMMYFIFYYIL